MGAVERLDVVINSNDLDAFLTKISNAKTKGGDETKRLNELNKKIKEVQENAIKSGIISLDKVPAINREMRTLLSTSELFREISPFYFRGRLGVKAYEYGRRAGALNVEGLAPEVAKNLTIQSLLGYSAMILFVTRLIYNAIQSEMNRLTRERGTYETLLLNELNITRKELQEISIKQRGYATWADQLSAQIGEEGLLDAITNYAWAKIKEFLIHETYLDETLDLINHKEEQEEARWQDEYGWFSTQIDTGG